MRKDGNKESEEKMQGLKVRGWRVEARDERKVGRSVS